MRRDRADGGELAGLPGLQPFRGLPFIEARQEEVGNIIRDLQPFRGLPFIEAT